MKILFLTDTHITAKTPSGRVDVATETLLEKWREIRDVVNNENVDLILHGGDFNNTPDVSNSFTGEIASIIRDMKAPMYVVPGNHDLYGYNISTLENTKLGVLESTGVIKILKRGQGLEFDDVIISGQEYYDKIDTGIKNDYMMDYSDYNKLNILVTHSMLMDHKFIDEIPHTVIDNVESDADIILAGHYHPGFETTTSNRVLFVNPGSLYRNSNSNYYFDKPGYVIINTEGISYDVKRYELKCAKPPKKIFKQKDVKEENYNLESFNRKLDEMNAGEAKLIDIINRLADSFDVDVKTSTDILKNELIKAAQVNIDKGYIASSDVVKINKVKLKNFQVHKDAEFEFSDGFNVISGESNCGKTSILRAIMWALYDKPNNNRFITTGARSCSVELHLSNGYVVTRSRSNSSAGTYKIENESIGYSEEFKGFSNKLPIEVSNATQMPEITIGGNKYYISILQQLDSHFIVRSGPTEAISLIGSLVGADEAVAAKKSISSTIREQNSRLEVANESFNKVCNSLEPLLMLDIEELELNNIEEMILNADKLKEEVLVLDKAIDKIKVAEEELEKVECELGDMSFDMMYVKAIIDKLNKTYEEYLDLVYAIDACETLESNIAETEEEISKIKTDSQLNDVFIDLKANVDKYSEMYTAMFDIGYQASEYKKLLAEIKSINVSRETFFVIDSLKAQVEELELMQDTQHEINKELLNIKSINSSLSNTDRDIKKAEYESDKALREKEELIEKLKSTETTCEHCGSIVNYEKLLEVI